MNNGAADMMNDIRDHGPHLLPETNGQAPLKTTYTGIAAIDYQLTVLALFFYNIVDGSHPGACLQAYQFCGQLVAGYGLLVLESYRRGNEWKMISFITLWGLFLQNAAMAVLIPVYFALHLSTSPTVSSKKQSDILPDPLKVFCVPVSIAIGFVLPSILVALPAPSTISYEMKQVFMAIWQVFPLSVGLLQVIIPFMSSYFNGANGSKNDPGRTIGRMRTVYPMMMTVAVVSRISTWTIAISTILFPSIFASGFVHLLTPTAVFAPMAATSSVKVPSIAAGAFQFLQYDEMVGAAATVLWSAALYINGAKGNTLGAWLKLITIGIAVEAVAGPQGFAVAAVWARDEMIFAHGNGQQNANVKKKTISQ
ncbi:MAG: hypothetical protein Q9222_004530 [Ikaeria aurantiellina]